MKSLIKHISKIMEAEVTKFGALIQIVTSNKDCTLDTSEDAFRKIYEGSPPFEGTTSPLLHNLVTHFLKKCEYSKVYADTEEIGIERKNVYFKLN